MMMVDLRTYSLVVRGAFADASIYKTYGLVKKRLAYYTPSNPRTSPQQANRAKFASAVSRWQALTPEEKAEYNRVVEHFGMMQAMSGYNYFINRYMLGVVT